MSNRIVVEGMSLSDIIKIYIEEDKSFVDHKNKELDKKYRKSLYPNRSELYFFSPVEFKRKNGLNIVFQYFDKGNTYHKDKRLGLYFYLWFNRCNCISAIRFKLYPGLNTVLTFFYTSHFLQRYIERELKDSSITKLQAINIFLRNNIKTIMKYIPSDSYPSNGWYLVNQGLCFCEVKPGDIIIMKTFLSWDYLKSGQISVTSDIITEANERGLKFPIPESILDSSDINAE